MTAPGAAAQPAIVLYTAASVDGFIATPDGGVAWLAPFETEDYGYREFMAGIGTVILGRTTFEQSLGFGEWPYPGKRTLVLTSRAVPALPQGAETLAAEAPAVARRARGFGGGDIWLCGGANVVRQFLDHDLVDRVDLFIVPVLLGSGVPLFLPSTRGSSLKMIGARPYPMGLVRLTYERAR